MSTLGDHLGCQGNISGDDQISAIQPFDNFIIGHVKPRGNTEGGDIVQSWSDKRLIGHQRHKNASPLRCPKEYLFDYFRTGVGIDPDMHSVPFLKMSGGARGFLIFRFCRASFCNEGSGCAYDRLSALCRS